MSLSRHALDHPVLLLKFVHTEKGPRGSMELGEGSLPWFVHCAYYGSGGAHLQAILTSLYIVVNSEN